VGYRGFELLMTAGLFEKLDEKFANINPHFFLSEIFFERGDCLKFEKWNEKGCRLIKDSRHVPSLVVWGKVLVMRTKSMVNPNDVDLDFLFAHSENNRIRTVQGLNSCYIGAILMNLDGHLPEDEVWI
jgi:hypothetical protein